MSTIGGDSQVFFEFNRLMGGAARLLDANSFQAGTFTEAREVGGKQAYLTPEGAAAFDSLVGEERSPKLEHDPQGLFASVFKGDDQAAPKRLTKEEFTGSVK